MTRVARSTAAPTASGCSSPTWTPATGTLADVDRRMEIVRLGEGVDRTGRIAPEAMERTLGDREVLRAPSSRSTARSGCVSSRRPPPATRATREFVEFADGVRARCSASSPRSSRGRRRRTCRSPVRPAAWPAAGARAVPRRRHRRRLDRGGARRPTAASRRRGRSTSAASGSPNGTGSTTRRPTAQVVAARADVDAALDRAAAAVPLERTRTLVGLAGSVTTMTAHALAPDRIRPGARSTGRGRPSTRCAQACDDLLADEPRAERAALPYMHPGRVDVIGAGALVWRRIVDRVGDGRPALAEVGHERARHPRRHRAVAGALSEYPRRDSNPHLWRF